MPDIRVTGFRGVRPRLDSKLIGQSEGTESINVRLTDGKLSPYGGLTTVSGVTSIPSTGDVTLFRMYDSDGDYWLGWLGDVDVARAPLAGDESFRIMFTGDSIEPRVTNKSLSVNSTFYPDAWYVLGVTKPVNAPAVSPSGGAGLIEDRLYVYTFVTEWGEESKPSPASAITNGKIDDTWAISGMDTAPPNSYSITTASWTGGVVTVTLASTDHMRVGEYVTLSTTVPTSYNATSVKILSITGNDITYASEIDTGAYVSGGLVSRDAPHHTANMTKRIYRSVTDGTVGYFFVGEVPAETTTFNDIISIVLGESIPTDTWNMPPTDMRGLINHPSGSLIGFSGNTVYVSEPLVTYGYPSDYNFTVDYPIVGLGISGTSVVVVTEGYPYVLQGATPDYMSLTRLDFPWHGASKEGITSSDWGVVWPTSLGLASYSTSGPSILTAEFYTQKEWLEVPYPRFNASVTDNKYFGRYDDDDGVPHLFVFNLAEPSVSTVDVSLGSIYVDAQTSRLYGTQSGQVMLFDSDPDIKLAMTWQSKIFDYPNKINFAVAQIEANFNRTPAQEVAYRALVAEQEIINSVAISTGNLEASMNGQTLNRLGLNASVLRDSAVVGDGAVLQISFNLYADGDLLYSTVVGSNDIFRLPSGVLNDEFQFRIFGTIPISSVAIATSTLELTNGR